MYACMYVCTNVIYVYMYVYVRMYTLLLTAAIADDAVRDDARQVAATANAPRKPQVATHGDLLPSPFGAHRLREHEHIYVPVS